jgi:hypothetical protein
VLDLVQRRRRKLASSVEQQPVRDPWRGHFSLALRIMELGTAVIMISGDSDV